MIVDLPFDGYDLNDDIEKTNLDYSRSLEKLEPSVVLEANLQDHSVGANLERISFLSSRIKVDYRTALSLSTEHLSDGAEFTGALLSV